MAKSEREEVLCFLVIHKILIKLAFKSCRMSYLSMLLVD